MSFERLLIQSAAVCSKQCIKFEQTGEESKVEIAVRLSSRIVNNMHGLLFCLYLNILFCRLEAAK